MVDLTPYVPRLVLRWAEEEPDAHYRRLEGTLAFCDLSGFTAMSEKLASLGRLGAEELADVLNLLFAALLDDAAAFGGGMLKYGGDAIVLFFEGGDHARRGAAAVHRMRTTLRHLGRVRTSKGIVRVRMSVGVHSGEFDFFLVGDSHRELIVAGQAATVTVDMEAAADAGEILLSPAVAEGLPASCVGAAKGDGRLLARAPRITSADAASFGDVPSIDPLPFIPVGLRDHLGTPGTEAEHRHIGVGFVAFGGVDSLLARDGGEATAKTLDAFIASCQRTFARYDVTFLYADIYGDGGKVFFIAGAPVAHEDNEERLIRAALEISATDHGLHLHTGLNRGYVFAGDVGSARRRTYTVLGDAVNTAARVMASCSADGQIRAMPSVIDLAASTYETEAQAPFVAKGKAHPLGTVAVGKPLGPRRSDIPLPLVGRANELAKLEAALADSYAGAGSVVALRGPAGIGKTRLVDEMLASVPDATRVFSTVLETYERTTPLFALRTLARALGDPDALPKGNIESGSIAARALTALWNEQSPGPSIWCVDNAHLLDEASADAIAALRGMVDQRPWLVLLVGRDDSDASSVDADTIVELATLDIADCERLATSTNEQLLPHEASVLATRSGGNPLFLRHLALAAGGSDGDLADSVETAVSARLDTLSPDARQAVRRAAVLGGQFDLDAWRSVHPGLIDVAGVSEFVGVRRRRAFFRQAIYREVALAGLTYRERRALHSIAGVYLEAGVGPKPIERLALHFSEAGVWDKAWTYSKQAGDIAFSSAAKASAAAHYARALQAGKLLEKGSSELAGVAIELGTSWYHAGKPDRARQAYRHARQLAGSSPNARAEIASYEGRIALEAADPRSALRWFRRGLNCLEPESLDTADNAALEVAGSLLVGASRAELVRGRLRAALQYYDRARALADRVRSAWLDGTVHNLALILAYVQRDLRQAAVHGRAAIEGYRADGRYPGSLAMQIFNLGAIEHVLGDLDDSLVHGMEAVAEFTRLGIPSRAAQAQLNLASVLLDQGLWHEAAETIADAERVLRRIGDPAAVMGVVLRARSAVREGRDAEPLSADDEDACRALGIDDDAALLLVERALAERSVDLVELVEQHRPVLAALAIWPALQLAIETVTHCAPSETGSGNHFADVLIRVINGGPLADDPEAKRLGIVDVPMWAKPDWLRTS